MTDGLVAELRQRIRELEQANDRLKASEVALQKSEGRLRAIYKTARTVSFIITDAQVARPTILEFSPGAEKTFGYCKTEVIGKPVSILHLPEDGFMFPDSYEHMREGQIGFSGEITMVRKTGETFPALYSAYPLLDEKGAMYGALGVSIDISKQRELEIKLRQAHKMDAIRKLAGGIAHDFNNILFPIMGYAEMLTEDLPNGSFEYQNAHQILKAGKRAADLVKQILTFSRHAKQKLKPVKIQQIVKDVLRTERLKIPPRVMITEDIQIDCDLIMADPFQLHQIVMNLITNAYHAVEETGGQISVTLRESELTDDDYSTNSHLAPGLYAVLSISDTGCGIDPNVINNVFDPYYTTKTHGRGTGLGLAMVYGIVKEFNGDIKVRSALGKGSTFTVILPVMKKASASVL